MNSDYLSSAIRILSADAIERAQSGHPGMPLGMADSVGLLFRDYLRFDPDFPDWADRDRFVLSAGHGSMLLYSILFLCGVSGVSLSSLRSFRQLGSAAAGHPEYGMMAGIETTTGPLGQGIANGVGMALCERIMNARFGDDIVDHRTWVVAGDGCLMEGISQESIALAGHLRLSRLCIIFDDNSITIDGARDLSDSTEQCARFRASGWRAESIDGHAESEIRGAYERALASEYPSLICCRTQIGKGLLHKAGKASSHGSPAGKEEIAHLREHLHWEHAPFELPDDLLSRWRSDALHAQEDRKAWERRFSQLDQRMQAAFTERSASSKPSLARASLRAEEALQALKDSWLIDPEASSSPSKVSAPATMLATRESSQRVLEVLSESFSGELVGGSADLSGSNGTKVSSLSAITSSDFTGGYIHYGVREHAMAGIMNGISLHGGVVVYGGTFLVFSDYCRPSLRLGALMELRVIHVMTHDSIALGEDGPTHQPIEHLSSLRAMPGLYVFRPCDSVEVAECWSIAFGLQAPSVLALSRQKLRVVRERISRPATSDTSEAGSINLSRRGAYMVRDAGSSSARLLSSGSEVSLCLDVAALLSQRGIEVSVVSFVCWELFDEQPPAYRETILGSGRCVAIEMASPFGWSKYTGSDTYVIGIDGFGASAPMAALLEKFGFCANNLADRVATLLS